MHEHIDRQINLIGVRDTGIHFSNFKLLTITNFNNEAILLLILHIYLNSICILIIKKVTKDFII